MIQRPAVEQGDEPEHRGDRRRFLIWALMLGAAPPERLTERIVAEIEGASDAGGEFHHLSREGR